jgi:hypothetical protein
MTKDDLSLRKKQIKEMITFSNQSYFFNSERLPIESNNIVEIFHQYNSISEEGHNISQKPYVNHKLELRNLTKRIINMSITFEAYDFSYERKDLQYKFLSFTFKSNCNTNLQIAKELNFEQNYITALINECNEEYSFYYQIPLNFFSYFFWAHEEIDIENHTSTTRIVPDVWLYSKTLDFKNDELFAYGLYEMFLSHNIEIAINDIRNNTLDAIKQFKLLKY